jgi:tight adherence protein B
MESQVPEAVELLAGALRSGRSTRQAIAAGASVGPPLGRLLADAAGAVELGRPLGDVLDELARAEPALAPSAAALRVGLVAGGDVARALDRLAEVTRQRLRLEGELGSLTAQVRLSGVVLGSLPLCALVLFSWAGPAAQRSFLREPWGQACLALGLLLDGAGFLLLQRLGRPAGVR